MDKDKSIQIKGIAILFMLFLHLFCYTQNASLCTDVLYIHGIPLAQILTRATYPVNFFLILGGYGLYILYQRGDNSRWPRIFKLYIHYWVIMAIFLVIGHYINSSSYPGPLGKFISNFTTYNTTYNTEMWFLLPYSILSLTSVWWFKLFDRFRSWVVILSMFTIHLITSYGISRYADVFFYKHYYLYNIWLVFHMLFNFSLGAIAARSDLFSHIRRKIKSSKRPKLLVWTVAIILVTINCVFKYNYFYAFLMTACFCIFKFPNKIARILTTLGRQSMNMWMIHSWLCYYLFHDFIYSFRYPIVIFVVLVAISYYIGTVIDKIVNPIEKIFLNKSQRKENLAI